MLIAAGRARQHHKKFKGQHKERDHRSGSGGFSEYLGGFHPLREREGNGRNVNVWLQSRSLPARGRVGLEVHRCLCIIDAGNVFISTVMG